MINTNKATTGIAVMEIYAIIRAFLNGNIESTKSYDQLIAEIEELREFIPAEEMSEIDSFVSDLGELVYGDAMDVCYEPDCGRIVQTANGVYFKIDTEKQLNTLLHRYETIVTNYMKQLDALAEYVLIPLISM